MVTSFFQHHILFFAYVFFEKATVDVNNAQRIIRIFTNFNFKTESQEFSDYGHRHDLCVRPTVTADLLSNFHDDSCNCFFRNLAIKETHKQTQ